jgi:putative transcription antitermination factor YqgF
LKNNKDPVHTIAEIITKEHIEHTVLGYSVDHTGKENSVMNFVHDFKEQLEKVTQIPVSFQKEFMTSVFARQDFDGKSKNNARQVKQKKIGDDDMTAAVLILQRFLEKK